MATIISSQLNPFRRASASLKTLTLQRYRISRAMRSLKQQDFIYDQYNTNKRNDKVSFGYRLFDCEKEDSIYKFMPYNDRNYGGQSKGQLIFDKENNCLVIEGSINARERHKMTEFPSIGMSRLHPYPIFCGPLNILKIQLHSDGEPIHVGVELRSPIEGVVGCYGIITSRIKGWRQYELPFQNMLMVGAQSGPRGSNNYEFPNNSSTFFNRQAYDANRILTSEATQPIIHDLNFRLLSTSSMKRRVCIRSIDIVSRAGNERFLKQYKEPFFYIMEDEPYNFVKDSGVAWLTKGYQGLKAIDLGDKIYYRK